MIRVLFVCLGNICRSPLAEAIFNQQVAESQLEHRFSADSAGTAAYHVGDPPDHRSRANALQNGLEYTHSARQFEVDDFVRFQYIIAMDASNHHHIMQLAQRHRIDHDNVHLMRDFEHNASSSEVPDPYYGGPQGFQEVFDILQRCNQEFIRVLDHKHNT